MLYNFVYPNTKIIYCHSTLITKVILHYNTEWQYDHGMEVNYCRKKIYNNGPWFLTVYFNLTALPLQQYDTWIRIRVTGSGFEEIQLSGLKAGPCWGRRIRLYSVPKWCLTVEVRSAYFWHRNGALLWRADLSFRNPFTGSGNVAK